jgi:hypothetical protein
MKMRRRALGPGVFAAVLLSAGWTVRLIMAPAPHHINRCGYDTILVGMTEVEVERALGVPAGLYSIQYTPNGQDFEYDPTIFSREGKNGEWGSFKGWISDEGIIFVAFGENKKVIKKDFSTRLRYAPPPGVIDRLRRWLRL